MIRFSVTADSSLLVRLENHRREIFATVEHVSARRIVLFNVRDSDGRVLPNTELNRTPSLDGVDEGDRVRLRVSIVFKSAVCGTWGRIRCLRPVLLGLRSGARSLALVA